MQINASLMRLPLGLQIRSPLGLGALGQVPLGLPGWVGWSRRWHGASSPGAAPRPGVHGLHE